ncbi:MAG TPA: hypothetical protein P5056_03055 [Candidatus Paceibacterota bacterium]|nr:hypothetical protein [Candidatus Paceibacterota bacterium]
MKYGNLTLGQIEALVNKLGGMEEVRKILSGQGAPAPAPQAPSVFLPALSVPTVPELIEPFVTKDHFNSVEGIWTGSDFNKEFRGMSVAPRKGYELTVRTLSMPANDGEILKELGDPDGLKAEIDLYTLHQLIVMQKSGRRGLLTTDYANIFYLRNNEGQLRAVSVSRDDGEWSVSVYSVSSPVRWSGGRRVFSRNS